MRKSKSLSLGMRKLTEIPDDLFKDAQEESVHIVDLSKNKLNNVPDG